MGTYFATFDSTPANLAADMRTQILNSTDWSQPNAGALPNLVKATTTAGAQMCVQLDDAAVTSKQMQMGVYRTHDGTTGVDKITRYLVWRISTSGLTSNAVHCTVSAGKEHLYFSVEGPRVGETNPDYASYGSYKQAFFLGAVTPYFAGADTIPTVACVSVETSQSAGSLATYVSRNQADNASWVLARLASVQVPECNSGIGTPSLANALQPYASDGARYLWPYIVIENDAGIRGRVSKLHFAGFNLDGYLSTVDPIPAAWEKVSYGGDTYILVAPNRSPAALDCYQSFGHVTNGDSQNLSPIVAVPYSTP